MLSYEKDAPQIPAAAITVEDAEWLKRMAAAGETVTVSLHMEARLEADADSANVIAEIRGSEQPDEVVVMGGHFDSWDVGQGAHDDGCSCMAAWQALTILKQLGLRPRRTLRAVLWVSEENSGDGGKAYRDGARRRRRAPRGGDRDGRRLRAADRLRLHARRPASRTRPRRRRSLALRRIAEPLAAIDAASCAGAAGAPTSLR